MSGAEDTNSTPRWQACDGNVGRGESFLGGWLAVGGWRLAGETVGRGNALRLRIWQETPILSPAHAGSFRWHVVPRLKAGVYFLQPPTAAEPARVAGFRQ